MHNISINDRASDFLGESTRERTPEGFLKVKGRVARAGIQRYYGYELGLNDSPFKLFSLYRPADVVLSDEVCKMFNGVDITNDHPNDFVSADNYRALTSGVVLGDAYVDPNNSNFIMCDMLIKDAETIKALEAGKVQLSVGYRNTIDMTAGKTPEGETFDAKVSKITLVNHVALVSRARAGVEARVFDADGGKMKTIKLGSQEFELQDAIADGVQQFVDSLMEKAENAVREVATKDSQLGELTAQVNELQKALEEAQSKVMTDEDIHAVLKTKEALMTDARSIAGDDFECDSFDSLEVMRSALTKSGCDVDMADKSEDFVSGFFRAAVANASSKAVSDSHKSVAKSMLDACGDKKDKKAEDEESPEQKEKKRLANAWREKKETKQK